MATPADDGFHEIQLNGKQLVFLFMAATVVSVVIFLCGVLVGRGVRTERTVAQSAALSEAPTPDILPSEAVSVPAAVQAGADPRVAQPPAPVDEKSSTVAEDIRPDSAKVTEPSRVETAAPPSPAKPEKTAKTEKSEKAGRSEKANANPAKAGSSEKAGSAEKPASVENGAKVEKAPEKPAPKPIAEPVAATSWAQKEPAPASTAATPAAPGDGYAVQVAAVNGRTDADAIAKRFSSKGYAAYVEVPPNGTGTVFRVRIGTFKTKREAETIAAKLQKEEQIKPWVTR
jgi:cell division septation protein DedD